MLIFFSSCCAFFGRKIVYINELLLFLFITWIATLPVCAQRQKIEEFQKIVAKLEKKNYYAQDTNYIQKRNMIAYYYWNVNPDSSILLGKQNLILAQNARYEMGKLDALSATGIGYWSKSDFQEAMSYFKQALTMGAKKGMGDAHNNIAMIHNNEGKYVEALENYFDALRIFESIQDKQAIATAYSNIALLYSMQGKVKEALETYTTALKINEGMGNKMGGSITLHNIGNLHRKKGDNPTALSYYLKAMEIKEKIDDKKGIASVKNSIGGVYLEDKNIQEAITYFSQALKIFEIIGDKANIAESLLMLGEASLAQKEYDKAFITGHFGFEEVLYGIFDIL
jgi:tetratricopeptide (TPR) repeat protein